MSAVELAACMFCLNTTPETQRYDGPCACKPHVHVKCLETWFKITPNECPICRTDYDPPEYDPSDQETTAEATATATRADIFGVIVIGNSTFSIYRYHFQCFIVFFLILYLAVVFELADK